MPRAASCFIAPVSSLDSALLEVVDRYWARFFGCAPEALRSDTVQTARDEKAVDMLRAACAVEEWEAGGSKFRPSAMVGAFRGQELAALAGYQLWGEQIAHIAILTHPAFRGQGHATTALSTLTEMLF